MAYSACFDSVVELQNISISGLPIMALSTTKLSAKAFSQFGEKKHGVLALLEALRSYMGSRIYKEKTRIKRGAYI